MACTTHGERILAPENKGDLAVKPEKIFHSETGLNMAFAVGMLEHALTTPYNKEGELATRGAIEWPSTH
jgi:hypothetical protein